MKGIRYIAFCILLFVANEIVAQGWLVQENNIETNWNTSFHIGRSAIMTEFQQNLTKGTSDMNHQFDWTASLRIAKMVYSRADLGLEFSYSRYRGYNYFPSEVNYLNKHVLFQNNQNVFLVKPITYHSDVVTMLPFFKYNFINFSSFSRGYSSVNIFLITGIGVGLYFSEMGYEDKIHHTDMEMPAPLFSSGHGKRKAVPLLSGGFGVNYQLNKRIFFSVETNMQFLYTDLLDGIPNYSDELQPYMDVEEAEKYRLGMITTCGKLSVGITYFFNLDTTSKKRSRLMPWYNNRYRSYYSRYQYRSTERERKLRLPFYGKDLAE